MSNLFTTFLLMIIGLALAPNVAEMVTDVTGVGGNNLTGSASSLAELIPLFWVIIVLAIGIGAIYTQFKGTGA